MSEPTSQSDMSSVVGLEHNTPKSGRIRLHLRFDSALTPEWTATERCVAFYFIPDGASIEDVCQSIVTKYRLADDLRLRTKGSWFEKDLPAESLQHDGKVEVAAGAPPARSTARIARSSARHGLNVYLLRVALNYIQCERML